MSLMQRDELENLWTRTCSAMAYAFQPIVNTYTGRVFGYEALLRGFDEQGFPSIHSVFDRAAADGVLAEVHQRLFQQASATFHAETSQNGRLFFNIDNRLFQDDESAAALHDLVGSGAIAPERVVLEISEKNPVPESAYEAGYLPALRQRGVHVALDDFGAGYSGLQVLYQAKVDVIKMDRFFISGIAEDAPKRIFVTNLVKLAHMMGMHVVAEGVETTGDFYTCREIGCDYMQGYLISRPRFAGPADPLPNHYSVIVDLIKDDRRDDREDQRQIERWMNTATALPVTTSMQDVLRRFRTERDASFLPVVNGQEEPLGIIREHDLKEYVYSPYGISLLMNRSYRSDLPSFVRKVPVAAIHDRLDRILELYSLDPEAEAILLTENGRYRGCLGSRSLLQILHQREVATARDQNPLTRLPGNTIINEHISATFRPISLWSALAYIDFDNFKPFNDRFGFRVGDRVIQLFADSLKRMASDDETFAGHIGGDDFFLRIETEYATIEKTITRIERVAQRFSQDVLAFYPRETVQQGYIEGKDRNGEWRRFPLLEISAAILLVPPHETYLNAEGISLEIAKLKKSAKRSDGNVVVATVNPACLRNNGCV